MLVAVYGKVDLRAVINAWAVRRTLMIYGGYPHCSILCIHLSNTSSSRSDNMRFLA